MALLKLVLLLGLFSQVFSDDKDVFCELMRAHGCDNQDCFVDICASSGSEIFNVCEKKVIRECKNGRITKLDFDTIDGKRNSSFEPGSNFISTLPDSIGNLAELTYLDLGRCLLRELPENIGCLQKLNHIDLSKNHIVTLPDSIGCLKSLTYLDFGDNHIKTVPDSYGSLTLLKEFHAPYNSIESLPESMASLSLDVLNIEGNPLSSEFLKELFGTSDDQKALNLKWNFTEIKKVLASRRGVIVGGLVVGIPITAKILSVAVQIYASNQNMGKIEIYNDVDSLFLNSSNDVGFDLEILYLDDNFISTLPDDFVCLTKLRELNLHKNDIYTLPKSFGCLSSLKTLDLSYNRLKKLPKSFKSLTNLESLNLEGNFLDCKKAGKNLPENFTDACNQTLQRDSSTMNKVGMFLIILAIFGTML